MIESIALGASAGGMQAFKAVLSELPLHFPASLLIVQHMDPHSDGYLVDFLNNHCAITVKEAEDKESLKAGIAYVAPPNYHMLVNPDRTLSLSVDEKVHYSRPSIDLLFESAADVFGRYLIGVILTGANADGAKGLAYIQACGGIAIVQNPLTAEFCFMPQAALNAVMPHHIVNLGHIARLLITHCIEGVGYDVAAHE